MQFGKKGCNVQRLRRCQRPSEEGGFKQRFKHRQCPEVLRPLVSYSRSPIASDPQSRFLAQLGAADQQRWEIAQTAVGGEAARRENIRRVTREQ